MPFSEKQPFTDITRSMLFPLPLPEEKQEPLARAFECLKVSGAAAAEAPEVAAGPVSTARGRGREGRWTSKKEEIAAVSSSHPSVSASICDSTGSTGHALKRQFSSPLQESRCFRKRRPPSLAAAVASAAAAAAASDGLAVAGPARKRVVSSASCHQLDEKEEDRPRRRRSRKLQGWWGAALAPAGDTVATAAAAGFGSSTGTSMLRGRDGAALACSGGPAAARSRAGTGGAARAAGAEIGNGEAAETTSGALGKIGERRRKPLSLYCRGDAGRRKTAAVAAGEEEAATVATTARGSEDDAEEVTGRAGGPSGAVAAAEGEYCRRSNSNPRCNGRRRKRCLNIFYSQETVPSSSELRRMSTRGHTAKKPAACRNTPPASRSSSADSSSSSTDSGSTGSNVSCTHCSTEVQRSGHCVCGSRSYLSRRSTFSSRSSCRCCSSSYNDCCASDRQPDPCSRCSATQLSSSSGNGTSSREGDSSGRKNSSSGSRKGWWWALGSGDVTGEHGGESSSTSKTLVDRCGEAAAAQVSEGKTATCRDERPSLLMPFYSPAGVCRENRSDGAAPAATGEDTEAAAAAAAGAGGRGASPALLRSGAAAVQEDAAKSWQLGGVAGLLLSFVAVARGRKEKQRHQSAVAAAAAEKVSLARQAAQQQLLLQQRQQCLLLQHQRFLQPQMQLPHWELQQPSNWEQQEQLSQWGPQQQQQELCLASLAEPLGHSRSAAAVAALGFAGGPCWQSIPQAAPPTSSASAFPFLSSSSSSTCCSNGKATVTCEWRHPTFSASPGCTSCSFAARGPASSLGSSSGTRGRAPSFLATPATSEAAGTRRKTKSSADNLAAAEVGGSSSRCCADLLPVVPLPTSSLRVPAVPAGAAGGESCAADAAARLLALAAAAPAPALLHPADTCRRSRLAAAADAGQRLLRLIWSGCWLCVLLWLLLHLAAALYSDIAETEQQQQVHAAAAAARCRQQHRDNKCELLHPLPPYLQQPCEEWKACLMRRPQHHAGRTKIAAAVVGDVLNAFFRKLEWRTIASLVLLLVAGLYASAWAKSNVQLPSPAASVSAGAAALPAGTHPADAATAAALRHQLVLLQQPVLCAPQQVAAHRLPPVAVVARPETATTGCRHEQQYQQPVVYGLQSRAARCVRGSRSEAAAAAQGCTAVARGERDLPPAAAASWPEPPCLHEVRRRRKFDAVTTAATAAAAGEDTGPHRYLHHPSEAAAAAPERSPTRAPQQQQPQFDTWHAYLHGQRRASQQQAQGAAATAGGRGEQA